MSVRWLEGRPAADAVWQRVQQRATVFHDLTGRPPELAIVSGADAAAESYARQIVRQFSRRGLATQTLATPGDTAGLRESLESLSTQRSVDGVLVLTPLAEGISLADDDALDALDPRKDVDGQHPHNLGLLVQKKPALVPATALGGLRLLEHYEVPLRGKRAVVVGRSAVVGLPLALLLLSNDASVSIAHSKTDDLASLTRQADVLCVAVGRHHLIGAEHVRRGAVVLDFGSHPRPDGAFEGDVQTQAVAEVAGALTPVPGGTGPMTVAVLAEQTVAAAYAGLQH
jgi:methylenetetrahydrofolate dehydrogenase (NADP+) / methenyltetrahydrofolate cyclohydrolase